MRSACAATLLVLGASLLSCRGDKTPDPDPLATKRARILELERWYERPASPTERMLTGAHLGALRKDAEVEQAGALGALPRDECVMPTEVLPRVEFVAKSLIFHLQSARWWEDVWLVRKAPADRERVAASLEATRRMYDELLDMARHDPEGAYSFAPEHVAVMQARVDERGRQLAAEQDLDRRAFLETSVAWWKARQDQARPK